MQTMVGNRLLLQLLTLVIVSATILAAPTDSIDERSTATERTHEPTQEETSYGELILPHNIQREPRELPESTAGYVVDHVENSQPPLPLKMRIEPRQVQLDDDSSIMLELNDEGATSSGSNCDESPSCNINEAESCHNGSQLSSTNTLENITQVDQLKEFFCPGELSLDEQFKNNTIFIGFLGSEIDPALAYQQSQNQGQCSTQNVYNPPIAEYIIALLLKMEQINNRTDILPYHKICLVPGISSTISSTLSNSFEHVTNADIPVVIDVLLNDISIFTQNLILPFSLPIVRYGQLSASQEISLREYTAISSFQNILRVIPGQSDQIVSASENNSLLKELRKKLLFTVGPERRLLHQAVVTLTNVFGWKIIGFVVLTRNKRHFNDPALFHTLHGENLTIVFVHFDLTEPKETFRVLIENEIQVVVFQGEANVYLELLKAGVEWGYVGNSNVWLFLYDGGRFPEEYSDLWQGYSREETFILKNALRGTLALGSNTGELYDQFLEDFIEKAENIAGDARIYEDNNRFLQTGFVYDSLWVIAAALNELVQSKADNLGIHQSGVAITKNDRQGLVDHLTNTSIIGVTGCITFTTAGKRNSSLFNLRNFVPIENDFQVNNSLEVDPWIVQTRGHLKIAQSADSFVYFYENGTVSQTSTIVFPDGTTNVPTDRPIRAFLRRVSSILISTDVSLTLFIGAVLIFILLGQYKDRRALLYNNSWIYKEERIDYSYDIAAQSSILKDQMDKYQRFSAILRPGAPKRLVGEKGIGKLRGEDIAVYITRGEFSKADITHNVYQEVEQLRRLEHPNICPFIGCILDVSTSALLYEYCHRGSLKDMMTTFHYGWIFQLSFALDAAKGLAYLHSKRIFHGRLKASCCVIDEQWNLKLTYYGLDELHPKKNCYNPRKSRVRKLRRRENLHNAPEILLLGDLNSQASDVYSYGYILQQMAQCQAHISEEQQDGAGSHELIPPKFSQLVMECLDAHPRSRPNLESIKSRLHQMSHYFTLFEKSGTGVIQIYSRNLEERLKESARLLAVEKDKVNELAYNYIPRAMVDSVKSGKTVPIKEYENTSVLCIEVTNMEELFRNSDPDSAEKTMTTMHKVIEGVIFYHDIEKLHSFGNMWILTSGSHGSTVPYPVVEAAQAALDILKTFSRIFVHGLPEMNPTIRIGFNTGPLVCGLLEGVVLQHISFGRTIQTAHKLMMSSKDGGILASATVADVLRRYPTDYALQLNQDTSVYTGEGVATFWVNKFEEQSFQKTRQITVATSPTQSSAVQRSVQRSTQGSAPIDPLATRKPQNIRSTLKSSGQKHQRTRHKYLQHCKSCGDHSCDCYSHNPLLGNGWRGDQFLRPKAMPIRKKHTLRTLSEETQDEGFR